MVMAATLETLRSLHGATDPINMLVVGGTLNEVDSYIKTLRNAGVAVHGTAADTHKKIEQALAQRSYEIALIRCDEDTGDANDAIDQIRDSQSEVVIILLSDDPAKNLQFAIEKQARDLLHEKDQERLAFSVRREYEDLLARRELKQVRTQLDESEQRCAVLITNSRDAIAYIHEGMHVKANQVYVQTFGFEDEEEIEGLPVMDLLAKDDRLRFKDVLRRLEKGDQVDNFEGQCLRGDGEQFDAELEFSAAKVEGEPCTQITIRDRSESRALQAKLRELTDKDQSTGLFNRQFLMQQLEEKVTPLTEQDVPVGLVHLRIANFAEVREKTGLQGADDLLREMGELLANNPGGETLSARLGDHDFALFSPSAEVLEAQLGRLLQTLAEHEFTSVSAQVRVQFDSGLASSHQPSLATAEELMDRAYRASRPKPATPPPVDTSPEQEEVAEPVALTSAEVTEDTSSQDSASASVESSESLDIEIVKLIERGLAKDRLQLVFQPIVSLQGDSRENYAVLVRLLDNNDEPLLPARFLPEAEQIGRMADIDRWVIRQSVQELVKQRKDGRRLNFFINISRAGICDDELLLWICDCLREFRAKGAWVSFQLRDADIRGNLQPARRLIEGLKKINCRIVIDHFRDNRSADTLLKHLPIDVVKLDPEFTKNLASQKKQQERMDAVNELAQSLGLKTIALGVEDANTLAVLWNTRINYIQGYFLQEPSDTISYDFDN